VELVDVVDEVVVEFVKMAAASVALIKSDQIIAIERTQGARQRKRDMMMSSGHLMSKDSLPSSEDQICCATIDDQQRWRNGGGMVDNCMEVSSEPP
jgi:hypothetical protein